MDWKQKALAMKIDGKSWTEVYSAFPDVSMSTIRHWINKQPEFRKQKQIQQTEDFQKSSIEYKKDGSIISEKFITVRDADDMTPEFILEAHGLNPKQWEVVSYKNNMWNTQVKGGHKQISYQSKLTAKPSTQIIDLDEIDKHFYGMDRKNHVPVVIKTKRGNMMAEVNIADLHLGKLCWQGETPENYDYKIAREVFYKLVSEIISELQLRPIEYITFVWTHDFFNSDNEMQQTTGGTPQDTDIREKKLFNVGVEMLVNGVEMLRGVAPVKIFYVRSNHDEQTGYCALKYLEAWFRKDEDVEIDTNAYPRKYIAYGKTLIGFCHGDKENDKGGKEKASRLASLMPIEAKKLWAETDYHEMHTAHLHSEQMIQEINGVIVRRISSPTALDSWHTNSGYIGAVRKAQTFIYDKEKGLILTINTPVT
jgi:hypothetical protein